MSPTSGKHLFEKSRGKIFENFFSDFRFMKNWTEDSFDFSQRIKTLLNKELLRGVWNLSYFQEFEAPFEKFKISDMKKI